MKKVIAVIAALGLCLAAHAQTNNVSTNQVPNLLGEGKQIVTDGYNTLTKLSFADGINIEPFGIYHKGDLGGGLAVSTTSTNSLNYGFAIAAINETGANGVKSISFYDTSFSLSYNGSLTVPVIGAADYYLETGAAIDAANPSAGIYNQSIAGLKKTFKLSDNFSVSLGGGIGYLSKWNDSFYIAHISIIDHLKGSHFFGLF